MDIEYMSVCSLCESHLTDLGIIKAFEGTVKKNFPDWPIDKQAELVICWFEKEWKFEMAEEIQENKKLNMKTFNKGVKK